MKISLCITTFNKPAQLKQVLTHVARMRELPDEVIVCDDGSGPETAKLIQEFQKNYRVPLKHCWHADEGWRVSAVRNLGIRNSTCDYLVFTDGDCIPHKDFLGDHKRLAETGYVVLGDRVHVREKFTETFSPDWISVLSSILFNRLRKRYYAIRNPLERPVEWAVEDLTAETLGHLAVGCNMAFWKKDIEHINGFCESLTGWALEDIEMVARLLVSGMKVKKIRRKALLFHLDHPEASYNDATILDSVKKVFEKKIYWTQVGLIESDQNSSSDS